VVVYFPGHSAMVLCGGIVIDDYFASFAQLSDFTANNLLALF
jgi:hypothetical protein